MQIYAIDCTKKINSRVLTDILALIHLGIERRATDIAESSKFDSAAKGGLSSWRRQKQAKGEAGITARQ